MPVRARRATGRASSSIRRLAWLVVVLAVLSAVGGAMWGSGMFDEPADISLTGERPAGVGGLQALPGSGFIVLPDMPRGGAPLPLGEVTSFTGRLAGDLIQAIGRGPDEAVDVGVGRQWLIWHGTIAIPEGTADWPTAHLIATSVRDQSGRMQVRHVRILGSWCTEISP